MFEHFRSDDVGGLAVASTEICFTVHTSWDDVEWKLKTWKHKTREAVQLRCVHVYFHNVHFFLLKPLTSSP